MSDEFQVSVPGETDAPDAAAPAAAPVEQTAPDQAAAPAAPRKGRAAAAKPAEDPAPDGAEARIAALELALAQERAAAAELAEENANLKVALEAPAPSAASEPTPPRAVGASYPGTAAEAFAAGIRTVVKCTDAYHVPPPLPVDLRA